MAKNNQNTIQKSGLGARSSRRLANTAIYILLVIITLVWLFPFFGIVMESFKVNTRAMDGELFPKAFGFDNYVRLFKETDFLRWFGNTAIMGENGPLTCKVSGIEVMGRDVSIVSTNDNSLNPVIRSIINSDANINAAATEVRYSLKPYKVFVFDKETEERLYFEV